MSLLLLHMVGRGAGVQQDPPTEPTLNNYYFDSVSGSDAGAGTEASPFQSIAKANTLTLLPGTTLHFKGGQSFTGNLVIASSGTADLPIIATSYGTGQAEILGGDGTGVKVQDAEYVHIHNLKVTGSGVDTSGATTNTGWGILFLSTQTTPVRWERIEITNNTVWGFRTGIMVGCDSGETPQTAWRGYNNITITHNDVSFCGMAGIWTWAKTQNSPPDWPVEQGGGQYPEIGPAADVFTNIAISYNHVHDIYGNNAGTFGAATFGTGIRTVNAAGGVVEFNRVHNVGYSGAGVGFPAGFEAEHSRLITWQFNEVSEVVKHDTGYDGAGFDVWDSGTKNMTVQYNWIHDCDGYGIGGGNSQNGIARFNTLTNCNRDGNVGDIELWQVCESMKIYNNTIYSTINGGVLLHFTTTVGGYIANNIFVSKGTRAMANLASGTFLFLNNLYYREGGALGFTINGSTYDTLAALRAAGHEVKGGVDYGMAADPLISSPATITGYLPASEVKNMMAYDLAAGSPARGAGVAFAELGDMGTKDFHQDTITTLNIGADAN